MATKSKGLFPNGTIYSISTKYGESLNFTDISNAKPALVTLVDSTIENEDILVADSNWARISDKVFRAANASPTALELEGSDTTNLKVFPANNGAGSLSAVKGWVQISGVRGSESSGGDQNYFTYQYLEDEDSVQQQKPTYKSARSIALTMDYREEAQWHEALIDADAKGDPIVLWAHLPNGVDLYYYVHPSYDAEPTMTMNENSTVKATFSLKGRSVRYSN